LLEQQQASTAKASSDSDSDCCSKTGEKKNIEV